MLDTNCASLFFQTTSRFNGNFYVSPLKLVSHSLSIIHVYACNKEGVFIQMNHAMTEEDHIKIGQRFLPGAINVHLFKSLLIILSTLYHQLICQWIFRYCSKLSANCHHSFFVPFVILICVAILKNGRVICTSANNGHIIEIQRSYIGTYCNWKVI